MKGWSLSKKIWSVFGLLTMAFIISVFIGQLSLVQSRDAMREIGERDVKLLLLTTSIRDGQRQLAIASLETIASRDKNAAEAAIKKFDTLEGSQKDRISEYIAIGSDFGKKVMGEYNESSYKWQEITKKAQNLSLKGDFHGAVALLLSEEAGEYRSNMLKSAQSLVEFNENRIAQIMKDTNTAVERSIFLTLSISILSIIFSFVVAFLVLRSLTRAIAEVVRHLSDSSIQVSSAANQIASSSEELSQAATEQAAALEETAASIEEMNSMVSKNSDSARSTADNSEKSKGKATEGKSVVQSMIKAMSDIDQSNKTIMSQVENSNENMVGIVKVIEEIGSKTKIINDIVFQTKLLSFNASVEAARAGEHGKGFAVVAEEVGSLAQMSGNAAKEIGLLLEQSVQKVNQIVDETRSKVSILTTEGKATVEGGTRVAHQCGSVLDEIVSNVTVVSSMATEIASASNEQARGCAEISKAMGQLDQMTQQNAATSEECAAAAEQLSSQAESLRNSVTQLMQTVNGYNSNNNINLAKDLSNHQSAPAIIERNVVPIKKAKKSPPSSASEAVILRKASGETPTYDHAGFDEV